MRKINTLIVDDEAEVAKALQLILKETCDVVDVKKICNSSQDALEFLRNNKTDLVFLDVQMPGGTGFEVLEALNRQGPYVIFTTGHSEFAIQAFRGGAVDYLLKPVDPDELVQAVQKVVDFMGKEKKGPPLLIVNSTNGIVLLNREEVLFIKADGRYSELHCLNGKHYLVCKNIGEYEEELATEYFFRVHKSYLVNCKHVLRIGNTKGDFVELSNGREIELSKRRKSDFLEFLK